jgi:hypothetical protein
MAFINSPLKLTLRSPSPPLNPAMSAYSTLA